MFSLYYNMAFAIGLSILDEMCEMKSNERNDPGIIFLFAVARYPN